MTFIPTGAIMLMASAAAVSGPPATRADVDARLKLLATAISQQQPGNADGKITSAEAGHLSITLHMAASGEIPPGSDAEAQPVVDKTICAVPMFRRMLDRYGITFHIVFTAPNWPTPINSKVVSSDCGTPASEPAQTALPAAPLPRPNAAHLETASSPSRAIAARTTATVSPLIYLKCTTIDNGENIVWDITLNEQEEIGDYARGSYVPQRRPARFTQDKVIFGDVEIDRTDLTIVYHGFQGDQTGQCRLAEKKQRAF